MYSIYVTIDKKSKKIIEFSGLKQNENQIELIFDKNSEDFYIYEKFLIPDLNFISKIIIKKHKNSYKIEKIEEYTSDNTEINYSNLDDVIVF